MAFQRSCKTFISGDALVEELEVNVVLYLFHKQTTFMKRVLFFFMILIYKEDIAQQPYEISIYEVVPRFSLYDQKPEVIKRHEITSLFKKKDSLWRENECFDYNDSLFYNKKDSFYIVTNGFKGVKIYGFRKVDTMYYFTRRDVYYLPKPRVKIESRLNKLLIAEDNKIPVFSKAIFLTNNRLYHRNVTIKKYSPTKKDIQLIKDNFIPYITKQFSIFCKDVSLETLQRYCKDTLHSPAFDTEHIKIEWQHAYIDTKQNKIIRCIIPSALISRGWYPYNPWCSREDMQLDGLRITCCINSQNELTFLRDELTYLEHGDFDNDGNDEFLFWYRRFNHNAYVLYYDDFQKSAKFEWTYH